MMQSTHQPTLDTVKEDPLEEERKELEPVAEEASDTEADTDDDEEQDTSDCDDELYKGLSKEQREQLKTKMNALQSKMQTQLKSSKEQEIAKIRRTFAFWCDCPDLEDDMVEFIIEFAKNHGIDVEKKAESQGPIFLRLMREMRNDKREGKMVQSGQVGGRRTPGPDEIKDDSGDEDFKPDEPDAEPAPKRKKKPKKERQPRQPRKAPERVEKQRGINR